MFKKLFAILVLSFVFGSPEALFPMHRRGDGGAETVWASAKSEPDRLFVDAVQSRMRGAAAVDVFSIEKERAGLIHEYFRQKANLVVINAQHIKSLADRLSYLQGLLVELPPVGSKNHKGLLRDFANRRLDKVAIQESFFIGCGFANLTSGCTHDDLVIKRLALRAGQELKLLITAVDASVATSGCGSGAGTGGGRAADDESGAFVSCSGAGSGSSASSCVQRVCTNPASVFLNSLKFVKNSGFADGLNCTNCTAEVDGVSHVITAGDIHALIESQARKYVQSKSPAYRFASTRVFGVAFGLLCRRENPLVKAPQSDVFRRNVNKSFLDGFNGFRLLDDDIFSLNAHEYGQLAREYVALAVEDAGCAIDDSPSTVFTFFNGYKQGYLNGPNSCFLGRDPYLDACEHAQKAVLELKKKGVGRAYLKHCKSVLSYCVGVMFGVYRAKFNHSIDAFICGDDVEFVGLQEIFECGYASEKAWGRDDDDKIYLNSTDVVAEDFFSLETLKAGVCAGKMFQGRMCDLRGNDPLCEAAAKNVESVVVLFYAGEEERQRRLLALDERAKKRSLLTDRTTDDAAAMAADVIARALLAEEESVAESTKKPKPKKKPKGGAGSKKKSIKIFDVVLSPSAAVPSGVSAKEERCRLDAERKAAAVLRKAARQAIIDQNEAYRQTFRKAAFNAARDVRRKQKKQQRLELRAQLQAQAERLASELAEAERVEGVDDSEVEPDLTAGLLPEGAGEGTGKGVVKSAFVPLVGHAPVVFVKTAPPVALVAPVKAARSVASFSTSSKRSSVKSCDCNVRLQKNKGYCSSLVECFKRLEAYKAALKTEKEEYASRGIDTYVSQIPYALDLYLRELEESASSRNTLFVQGQIAAVQWYKNFRYALMKKSFDTNLDANFLPKVVLGIGQTKMIPNVVKQELIELATKFLDFQLREKSALTEEGLGACAGAGAGSGLC